MKNCESAAKAQILNDCTDLLDKFRQNEEISLDAHSQLHDFLCEQLEKMYLLGRAEASGIKEVLRHYKSSELKAMLKTGELLDIKLRDPNGTVNTYGLRKIGFNVGVYGCNAEIYMDTESGQLYIYRQRGVL